MWYESLIWVANSYIAQKKYKEAETVITLIRSEQNFPKKLRAELELVNTDLFLQQENWTKAATPLTAATDLIRKKRKKARFIYILAQLYEQDKNYTLAEVFSSCLPFSSFSDENVSVSSSSAKSSVSSIEFLLVLLQLSSLLRSPHFFMKSLNPVLF